MARNARAESVARAERSRKARAQGLARAASARALHAQHAREVLQGRPRANPVPLPGLRAPQLRSTVRATKDTSKFHAVKE